MILDFLGNAQMSDRKHTRPNLREQIIFTAFNIITHDFDF